MQSATWVIDHLPDRRAAGRRLAERLLRYATEDPVVLALPRGGVPVAYEIAERLRAPLDVLIARKVGAPENPEYGLGAVVEGGHQYLDIPRVRAAGTTVEYLRPTVIAESREVERRVALYRRRRPRVPVAGRTVILVDDGVATGGTVLAAIQALRSARVPEVVVALGVCPPESLAELAHHAEEVVVLLTPEPFFAVGQWYADFSQVTDAEVVRLLRAARHDSVPAPGRSPLAA